jgi:hypothetical protein
MTTRIFAIALLLSVMSSPVIAQGGAGGGAGGSSAGGAAGGAPGSAPSGTAGVSPSTSNPSVGTAGVPGPSSGAGLPGGPGNTTVAPNQPVASSPPAAGRSSSDTGAGLNITTTNAPQGGGSPADAKAMEMQGTSAAAAEFHPEAVIDRSLDQASADITAMSPVELRRLVALFDQCTVKQHPVERAGQCAAASKRYKSEFGKNRAVDRAMTELERVVRFQHMFRAADVTSTEYEDNINNRLRGAARLALASTDQTAQVSLKQRGAR